MERLLLVWLLRGVNSVLGLPVQCSCTGKKKAGRGLIASPPCALLRYVPSACLWPLVDAGTRCRCRRKGDTAVACCDYVFVLKVGYFNFGTLICFLLHRLILLSVVIRDWLLALLLPGLRCCLRLRHQLCRSQHTLCCSQ